MVILSQKGFYFDVMYILVDGIVNNNKFHLYDIIIIIPNVIELFFPTRIMYNIKLRNDRKISNTM
jgi:hypothetical protein